MSLREVLERFYEEAGVEKPAGLGDLSVDLLSAEVGEMLKLAAVSEERELIHFPHIIPLTEKLPNGSQVFGVDYRTVPGGSSKVIPLDHEFEMSKREGEVSLEKTPRLIMHSSGNASIWFTKIARGEGFEVDIVIMDFASTPRLNALCALGANVHLVRGELGVDEMINRARQIEADIKGSKFLDQTHSPDNFEGFIPQGRRAARKLMLSGLRPTHFVAGVGTGGTWTGMSMGMQQLVPECQCVAVEVGEKPMLFEQFESMRSDVDADGVIGHRTEGDDYWIETYDHASQVPGLAADVGGVNLMKLFEEGAENIRVMKVSNLTGHRSTRLLAREHGHFVGPSTGTAFAGALAVAESNENAVVVMPICDSGFEYEGDIWHQSKRSISRQDLKDGLVGSSLVLRDSVHQDYRTDHLKVKEMGGPLSTATLLHLSEVACRDLERELGLHGGEISTDSLGLGFEGDILHREYVPVGGEIAIRAELINVDRRKDGKVFLDFTIQVFSCDEEGNFKNKVTSAFHHKRCILDIHAFREKALAKHPESVL